MFKQKIFIASFIILVVVAVFNNLGIKLHWYYYYPWFDIPMHFLGGLWFSLVSLSFYSYFYKNISIVNYRMRVFGFVIFAVLSIGISWEVFELIGGITFWGDRGYWLDTSGDILNDFLGGVVAYLFFIKRKKCNVEIEVVCENNNIIK